MRLGVRLTVVFGLLGLVTVTGVSTVAWWLAANESRDSIDAGMLQRVSPLGRAQGRPLSALESAVHGGIERDGSLDRLADGQAEDLVDDLTGGLDRDVDDDALPFLGDPDLFNASGDATQVRLLFEDGSTRGELPVELSAGALAALDGSDPHFESVDVDGTPYRVITVPVERGDAPAVFDVPIAGVQLARDVTNENAALSNLAVRLALLSSVGVAAVVAASWLVGRWLTKPINQLTTTAEHLAELDDLPGRVEVGRNDEIGRLADSYNRLMSALEVGREQQRRLVADASHELRTPLTSLRMRVEYLEQNDVPAGRRAEILRAAVSDAEQLSALVTDLVDLAADVRSADEEPEPVDLGGLIAEVAERAARSSGRTIALDVDGATADVRPTMVRRALHNLLDNAIKYGAPDGRIVVRSRGGAIEVLDDGPGIAPEDAMHVFDRFYRSPKARSRPGNGIGLAIVKQVADAHGGAVWARQRPGGGAIVGFSVTRDVAGGESEQPSVVASSDELEPSPG